MLKFACTHCAQRLEVDDSWPGGQFNCPTCGEVVSLPKLIAERPPVQIKAPASPPTTLRKSQLDLLRWRRAKIARRWAAGAAALGVLVAGYAFRDDLVGVLRLDDQATEAAQSVSAPTKKEAAVALPADVEPLTVQPDNEAGAAADKAVEVEPDAMAWLAENKKHWPAQVKLREASKFPVIFQGRAAGAVTVPDGTKVDLLGITTEAIQLRFRDGIASLPHGSTDLAELAPTIREKAQSLAATTGTGPVELVAPTTTPESDPGLLAEAQRVDGMIKASLAKSGRPLPDKVDDARFLRRTYLTAVGRIPTAEEAAEFLAETNPHKRRNLVSRLVRSPGYASQMSNWVFDRLRIVDYNTQAQIRLPVYRQWVRDAVETNMPWDRMVTSLLTGLGGGWDDETATVGYFTRDRGMPLDNLAITMRVFLGSRMECAQCHNDPFGDTKQKAFFRLAAFTNGQDPVRQDVFQGIYREMMELPLDSVEYRAARMFWQDIYGNSLGGGGTGRIALPHDYQYRDARPGDIEGAKAPFGKLTSTTGRRDRDDGRRMLAEWMTEGTGERFPVMIANSMWRKVMGRGFFEPGDEYVEPAEAHDPAVARHLSKLMGTLNYNLRDFQEVLMLTAAFQAAPNPGESEAVGGAEDFRGRPVQRLTAEQVWDSLVTLVSGNPDQQQAPWAADRRIFVWGQPVLEGQMDMAQLSREVLAIDDEKELREYFTAFVDKLKAERAAPAAEGEAAMTMRADPVGFVRGTLPRASELPSPAPRSHFVALFGQSGRDVVDGATREPNIGQVLSLMNGFVQQELIAKEDSKLNETVREAPAPADKIRELYLAIFSREPTADETAALEAEFERAPAAAQANIASAMLMSAEFLYLQ